MLAGDDGGGTAYNFFKWLSEEGDRWSQIAGIEGGIRSVPNFPSLEPIVTGLIETIRDEDMAQPDPRLKLTASLFTFADGELSRARTLEREPPFWRRLCATAQAATIEKELIRPDPAPDPKLWGGFRGESFYMQTMADLRIEPRWLPDLMSAENLRYNFLPRARIAAEDVKDKLRDGRFRHLLLGKGPSSLERHTPMPAPYIPSPVENASSAPLPFPEEMLTELRSPTDDKPFERKVINEIVNLALVFRFDPEVASLIAAILRRVKYRLSMNSDSSVTFSLLAGLAIVAGVTRGVELSDELRVLTRVLRRRGELKEDPENEMRIVLYACSSRSDFESWCKALGD